MTTEQVWVGAACAAATLLALVALVLALVAQGRARRAEALVADLGARLDTSGSPLSDRSARPHADAGEEQRAYVITDVDRPTTGVAETAVARPIDGRLFVDIVARESVVKAASWTHGLRRALSAEHRNRIRFAVRQETRRAGRDRRAETKQALREFRARERAAAPVHDTASQSREDVA